MSMNSEERKRLLRSPDVVARQIAGEHILVPISQTGADLQKVYLLNGTAAAIWELLAQPLAREELVKALEEQYDAPEGSIPREVETFVQDLLQRGFLTEGPRDE
jgi:hypothetical protein